jgi:hypothetical protein
MRFRVHPRYASGTRAAGEAIRDARAQAHRDAVEPPAPVEAALRGREFQLRVRIEDYQFPWKELGPGEDGCDANWLVGTVWVKLPDGREHEMDRDPFIQTNDLEWFVENLEMLVRERSGAAKLMPDEPGVGLTITMSDGVGTISGWVTGLEFQDIPTDLTLVQETLEQFTALAAAFPPKRPGSEPPQPPESSA